jgi:hypothetical protein
MIWFQVCLCLSNNCLCPRARGVDNLTFGQGHDDTVNDGEYLTDSDKFEIASTVRVHVIVLIVRIAKCSGPRSKVLRVFLCWTHKQIIDDLFLPFSPPPLFLLLAASDFLLVLYTAHPAAGVDWVPNQILIAISAGTITSFEPMMATVWVTAGLFL